MAMELVISPAGRLRGRVRVPGDKSISHRAALIGALARGDTVIHNFLRADDCLHTVGCLRALGVGIEDEGSRLIVRGMGPRWRAPMTPLDAGNSGTTMRLLAFGAPIRRDGDRVSVTAAALRGNEVRVCGDISSAAFLLAAAAAMPGSELTVEHVGLNPTRTGFLDVLRALGAEADVRQTGEDAGEPVGAVTVRGQRLRGVRIGGSLIPRVIDELPVLCVIATAAEGETVISDAAELRVKESDRIAVIARGLRALGGEVEERPDGLTVYGSRLHGGRVGSAGDHRIAMAFAVAGLLAGGPVTVEGAESIAVSFPEFTGVLRDVVAQKA